MVAISFLGNKKQTEKDEAYTPKNAPPRDSGGKFVSTNKKTKSKKEESKKVKEPTKTPKKVDKKAGKKKSTKKKVLPKGPFPVPYGESTVRRFYKSEWYYSVEDLLAFGYAEKQFKPLNELKKDKKVKDVFNKNIVTIMEVDCANGKGSDEILRAMTIIYNVTFPGSFLRWIDDISKLPFNIVDPTAEEEAGQRVTQGNPSDRG